MNKISPASFNYLVRTEPHKIYHVLPKLPFFEPNQFSPTYTPQMTLCGIEPKGYERTTHIKPNAARCKVCENAYISHMKPHTGASTTGVYVEGKKLMYAVANRLYRVSVREKKDRGLTVYYLNITNTQDKKDKFSTRAYRDQREAWDELSSRVSGASEHLTATLFPLSGFVVDTSAPAESMFN